MLWHVVAVFDLPAVAFEAFLVMRLTRKSFCVPAVCQQHETSLDSPQLRHYGVGEDSNKARVISTERNWAKQPFSDCGSGGRGFEPL